MNAWFMTRLKFVSRVVGGAIFLVALLSSGINTYADPVPGVITVNTSTDDNVVNHNCTLREAITAANTNTKVDLCPAGTVKDRIIFTVGTVNVAGPLPAIIANSIVTIDGGSGQPVVLHQLFGYGDLLSVNASARLNLTNLYFQVTSTCVKSAGILTITNSTFSSCRLEGTAGQINIQSSTGGPIDTHTGTVSLIITNSAFSGGYYATFLLGNGPATITRSTFGNPNHVSIAGGNPLTISRSIFIGNGIGSVAIISSALTLTNSIVTGADVAVEVDGQGTITNSTLIGNDIGIGMGGLSAVVIKIQNTILSNSISDCGQDPLATFVNDGNNTQRVGDCGGIPIVDPNLGTDFFPLPGSPVIDAGLSSWCPQDDIYGTLRPVDGDGNGAAICDIGAVEFKT